MNFVINDLKKLRSEKRKLGKQINQGFDGEKINRYLELCREIEFQERKLVETKSKRYQARVIEAIDKNENGR
jgi:uncharacterized membrane protein